MDRSRDFRLVTGSQLAELQPPLDAEAYLCGSTAFRDEISAGVATLGVDASQIHIDVRDHSLRGSR